MGKITWEIINKSIHDLNQYTDEIIAKYKARMTVSKIAKTYNTYSATVTRLLKNNGIEIRQRTKILSSFLQKHTDEIINMYTKDGLTPREIGEKFGVKRHQINYILEKNGVQKNSSDCKRKYEINEYYFDNIDTQNKAYILGFLYADGCNHIKHNNTITLELQQKDVDMLELIKNEIGSSKPLYWFDTIGTDGVERHTVSMVLNSKHMCEILSKWGCVHKKTFLLEFPDFLEERLYSHFIRGYFDRDGCASIAKESGKNRENRLHVTIMSSIQFCEGLQKHLHDKCNINFNLNHPTGKKEENGLLRSSSNIETKKFFEYIYKDADLYMKRKYNKFTIYFGIKD